VSIQGAPERRPLLSPAPAVERSWQPIDENQLLLITLSTQCFINQLLGQLPNRLLQSLVFALAATASQASFAPSHRV
jgi:hypothetical protein